MTRPSRRVFDAPIDAPVLWVALALVGAALFGVVEALPRSPPDATGPAETVDRVAAASHAATAEHPLPADAVRLRPTGIALRGDGGVARARFSFGPVAVVVGDSPLADVLRGVPPSEAFGSRAAFDRAVGDARTRTTDWRSADGPLFVRRLSWGGTDVTLVGT